MPFPLFGVAVTAGVAAALKFFQQPVTQKALAKAGEQVMKTMQKAVKAASKIKK